MNKNQYKVLIVEDEPLERKALSVLLERMNFNFDIKFARTAPEFEEVCPEYDPDLILLDIHIPGGDGLTSLRHLRESEFAGEVILVTAYDVFQYAQKAMGLGVSSFMVKPVTPERFEEVVTRVIDAIEDRRNRNTEVLQLKHFIHKNRGSFAMRMIQDLIRSGQISPAMSDVMSSLNLPPAGPCHLFGVIAIAADRSIGTESLFLWEDFEKTLGDEVVTIPWDGSLSFFLVPSDRTMADVERWVSRFLEVIMKNNSAANVVYGGVVKKLKEFPSAVAELEEALEESLLEGVGRAIMRDGVSDVKVEESSDNGYQYNLDEIRKNLEEAFLNNHVELLTQMREKLDQFIRLSPPGDLNMVKFMITGLMGQICQILLQLRCDSSSVAAWSRRQMLNMISIQTPMSLIKLLPESIEQAWNIRASASDPAVILVQQALYYIDRHYDEVTLEKTAEEVHVSPSYLSRTFRRVLGDRFVDRVKSVRLQKAKSLLIEGVPVRDVAISVGYGNIAYFSTLFKQYVGVSPSDYSKTVSV